MKRKMILVASIILLIASASLFSQGSGEKKNENVTLQLLYWDNVQKPVIDDAVEKFEAENPNIKVEATVIPWSQYWQKLQTTTVSGNAPDVFWMNVPNFQKYSDSNLLLDLSSNFEKSGVDVSKYPQALINKYSKDGVVYAVPEQYDTIALAYNKELFDEAGLAYPTADWTWDDVIENAKKLTKDTADGKQYGYLSNFNNQNCYYNFIVTNGGYILSEDKKKSGFDDPSSIEGMQFLIDLMYEYNVAPDGQQLIELPEVLDVFTSGRAAMATVGSYGVPILADSIGDKIDFAPIPKSPRTNDSVSIIHGLGWAGYANTKYPEETWKLINFLIAPEFNKSLATSAITIPAYQGMAEDWKNAIPYYNLQTFIDAVEGSYSYPASQKTAEWMSIEQSLVKDMFLNNISVEEGMKSIAKQVDEILATEN